MKKLWCFMVCVPFWVNAQVNLNASALTSNNSIIGKSVSSTALRIKGIQWTKGLSFQEVQDKARKEGKCIFLDCHATWCGPCKEMDRNVYVNDSIGDFFNKHFISVKVQMDISDNDDENVKSWYKDAEAIGKRYRVDGLPSFIFLSPQGVLLQQDMGFKKNGEFMELAKSVIVPGKAYKYLYSEYDSLVDEYKKGIVHYDRLLYMLKIAQKFDTALLRSLTREYSHYIRKLEPSKRYTKEHIEFWNNYVLKSSSREFQYFYKDGKLIDRVMQENGFASTVVDKTIYYEMVLPFFEEQNTNKAIPMSGMYLSGSHFKNDSLEADWKKLYADIQVKYNSSIAKRNVLNAKIEWYMRHWNYQAYCETMLVKLEEYPPNLKKECNVINGAAWNAFLHVTDKEVLNSYIKWMEKVVAYYPQLGYLLDTYANLLYKMGRKQEAIVWEEKAMLIGDIGADAFRSTLEKMKQGADEY